MSRSEFWKDRQAEFEKYATQFADLKANWKSVSGRWILWWGSTRDGIHIPQECKDIFNAIARKAVTELPGRGVSGSEPWRAWLDFMRARGWSFRVTHNHACTEQEWDAGVKDGKPLAQIRREQKYTTGDEWKKVYKRTKTGKLRRLSAKELEGKSSESLQKYYHWLEDGTIEPVFEASAQFCEDLSSRAFASEAVGEQAESPESSATRATAIVRPWSGSTDQQPTPKFHWVETLDGFALRWMYHATDPPVMVYSAKQLAELGPEWSEQYI